MFVQVRAGVDVINQEATWELQALDPETGKKDCDHLCQSVLISAYM